MEILQHTIAEKISVSELISLQWVRFQSGMMEINDAERNIMGTLDIL